VLDDNGGSVCAPAVDSDTGRWIQLL
jgi:hypothetical protein